MGTDLLYAALTKMGGVAVHHRQGHVDWRVAGWLSAGSVPAALLVLAGLSYLHLPEKMLDTLFAGAGRRLAADRRRHPGQALAAALAESWGAVSLPSEPRIGLTIATGVALGALVTLSSIGAGALGTLTLFLLYPALSTSRLVGTEIAHAVPLTLVAGLGHAGLGNVDVMLLANLLLGSLPGIWLGSKLTRRLAERWLRPTLALMLGLIGAKLVF